jgi:hypothetical protein
MRARIRIANQMALSGTSNESRRWSRTQPIDNEGYGLIVNADDWGRTAETTDRIRACQRFGVLSSASGMVFMEDSERAAEIANESKLDVGLHLNFTTPFSGRNVSSQLLEAQNRITKFLRSSWIAQAIFHPGLSKSFRYVFQAQIEEFCKLYRKFPERIDGHHHMHLCANIFWGNLLPKDTIVRRSFSFQRGQKSGLNRMYRRWLDKNIEKRHPATDYFFSIEPIGKGERLGEIIELAKSSLVELETHPVNTVEFNFLTGEEFSGRLGSVKLLPCYRAVKR